MRKSSQSTDQRNGVVTDGSRQKADMPFILNQRSWRATISSSDRRKNRAELTSGSFVCVVGGAVLFLVQVLLKEYRDIVNRSLTFRHQAHEQLKHMPHVGPDL